MAIDRVNNVFAITLQHIVVSATLTNTGSPTAVGQFENGISIGWQVVAATGTLIHTLDITESDTENGIYTSVATDRFIFPELFVKKFSSEKLLVLGAATEKDALVSYFGLRDLKGFIRANVATVLSSAGTANIIVNMYGYSESSPVRENQLTIPGQAPRPILEP